MVEGVTSKIFIVTKYVGGVRRIVKAYRDREVGLDETWYSRQEDEMAGLKTRYAVEECELVEVMPSMEP